MSEIEPCERNNEGIYQHAIAKIDELGKTHVEFEFVYLEIYKLGFGKGIAIFVGKEKLVSRLATKVGLSNRKYDTINGWMNLENIERKNDLEILATATKRAVEIMESLAIL